MRRRSIQNCFIRPSDAMCHAFVTLRDRSLA